MPVFHRELRRGLNRKVPLHTLVLHADTDYFSQSRVVSDVNEAAGGFEDSQIGHDRVIGVANGIEDPAVRFDDFVGRVIDERLVLTSFIAEGGMGGVFKAYDRELNRELCVKLMLPELVSRSDSMKRFQREARNLSKLDLPDVVRVFQFGVHDGYPFLAMEYAEGEPLSVLAASRTPPAEAIELTIKICRALSRVHEAGLVHRDLKPDNILVVDRATHQIKLIDFGLSALDQRSSLTQSNVILGTPVYLAPECFRSTSYSPVVDIYSVGCILFELVTGERLFRSTSLAGLLAEKSLGANSSLPADSANLETRQRLEVIIQKCCAAPLDKRFQDCDSVIHALQAVQRCCSNTEFEELLGGPLPKLNARSSSTWIGTALIALIPLVATTSLLLSFFPTKQAEIRTASLRSIDPRSRLRVIAAELRKDSLRKEELMDRITEVSTILPSINRHDVALRLQSYLLLSDLTATVFSKSPEPLWAASAIESARDALETLQRSTTRATRLNSLLEEILGERLIAGGALDAGVKHLERALSSVNSSEYTLKLDPELPGSLSDEQGSRLLFVLAERYRAKGEFSKAKELYNRSIAESNRVAGKLRSNTIEAICRLSLLQSNAGQNIAALEQVRKYERLIAEQSHAGLLDSNETACLFGVLSEGALCAERAELAVHLLKLAVDYADATIDDPDFTAIRQRLEQVSSTVKDKPALYLQCQALRTRMMKLESRRHVSGQ